MKQRRLRIHAGHLFVLPHVVLLVLFGIGPAIYALLLTTATFERGIPTFFTAGADNFVAAFGDFRFASAMWNIARYLAIALPLGVLGVIGISLLIHGRQDRLGTTMRTAYFVPGAVAGPTVVILAIFMFDPQISPFGPLFEAMGVTSLTQVTREANLPLIFALLAFFAGAGGWIAIFYGALNGISREIIEAAVVDGASPMRLALSVKLPLIGPYVFYMLILTFAGNVQLFAEPQLLAYGPGTAISAYWSPNQLAYAFAFELGQFGRAAAMSLLMVSVGLLGAVLVIKFTNFFSTDATAS